MYSIVVQLSFSFWLFLYIRNFVFILIDPKSEMNRLFDIMARPNISWMGVPCNMVMYVLRTAKSVTAKIPDQGSSSSRQLFCKSKLFMRFYMTGEFILILNFLGGYP